MLDRENPCRRAVPRRGARGFAAGLRSASITARAIGAAVAPPVRLCRSSATAIATCGRSPGRPANAMNQVVFCPATPVSAVPVLPPIR